MGCFSQTAAAWQNSTATCCFKRGAASKIHYRPPPQARSQTISPKNNPNASSEWRIYGKAWPLPPWPSHGRGAKRKNNPALFPSTPTTEAVSRKQTTLSTARTTLSTAQTTLRTAQTTLRTAQTTLRTAQTTLRIAHTALRTAQTTLRTAQTTLRTAQRTWTPAPSRWI